ncbi:MAG: TIGR03619 family F420-dependent LLM class oxidoreductase [Thermoproteota archaeon]|nr:TIGR03619 family F420-dependent LLM class oxidoreductase [Thermoproteota archaeon]
MKFGVASLHHDEYANKESINKIAEEAEKLEYDSIWVSDHIITPVYQGKTYGYIYESLITLSYLAAKTENLKLGTSILVLPLREPVLVAKQLATLDQLSNGRLIVGLGAGWLKEEFDFLKKDFKERGKKMDEYIIFMKKLWSEGTIKQKNEKEIEYYFEPKPLQKGGPRILIGGNSKRAIIRAVKLGDGWNPVALSPSILEKKISLLRKVSDTRKMVFLRIGILPEVTHGLRIVKTDQSYYLSGSIRDITEDLEKYYRLNVDHIIAYFGSVKIDNYIERMKKFRDIMRSFQS